MSDEKQLLQILDKFGISYIQDILKVNDRMMDDSDKFKDIDFVSLIKISNGIGYPDFFGVFYFTIDGIFITWGLFE